ncbi:MAG: GIY-YIG nuclease family protein [Ruminococcaceae bacterium]|nr:GIY-YIG nuclease family protein [Oscillospiraceae bacterium]
MADTKGVIYILTNPSFPDYVKIGYADDAEKRLVDLNRSECIPFAFRIYATYEVPKRLTDLSLHNLIDKLNPTLRAIDTFNGKPRKKEFYAMSKEDAYSLLEAIAEIHDRTDCLKLYPISEDDKVAEDTAELVEIEVSGKKKTQPISLGEYLNNKNQDMVEIYIKLQSEIFDALDCIEMYVLPQYIGWKVKGIYFAEIHIQRNRIMMLTLEPSRNYTIGNKVPDNFLWSLNYRSYFDSVDDVEEAKCIIKESYNQRITR